jgi:hypothetical protein
VSGVLHGGHRRRSPAAVTRRAVPDDRGAAAVELALVLPVLLLILFGIIDFGRMLNTQITLTEAAREGARATALGLDAGPRVQRAVRGTPPAIDTTTCPTDADPGADAVVVLSQPFEPVTPLGAMFRLFGGDGDGRIVIRATGVMPCVG